MASENACPGPVLPHPCTVLQRELGATKSGRAKGEVPGIMVAIFGLLTVGRGAGFCKTQGRVSDPGAPPTLFTDILFLPLLSFSVFPIYYGWLVNWAVTAGEGISAVL